MLGGVGLRSRLGGEIISTHPCMQGRVATGLVESKGVVKRVVPMPHAIKTQAAMLLGIRHPSRTLVSLSHSVVCV